MVTPFTDLRDGDAENLLNLVLSGPITSPTLHGTGSKIIDDRKSNFYQQITTSV
jgi:hypothetical protein